MLKIFDGFKNLKYGISKKSDGAMELATANLMRADNRQNFFQRQGIDALKIISPRQIHSAKVEKVGAIQRGKIIPDADGLVTDIPDLFLTVTVADCFPIYFYNKISHSTGLAHSGWRGTVGNLADRTAKVMPGNPADLLAGIGPGIGPCHFEVKDDVLKKFSEYPEAIIKRSGKIFIDLPIIIKEQLINAGLKQQNIENCGECTYCLKEKYFSFRRDKPKNVEAMIAYIGVVR
jgi:polyphenol oxidase